MFYVYILKCSDNSFYTGVTNHPKRRFSEHCEGLNPKSYTFRRRPLKMVYCEMFADINQAIDWEKQIKGWSRKKKIALINDKWEELPAFSICQNSSHSKNKSQIEL